MIRSMPRGNIQVCARTHEHCAGSLCTGKSNNNNGGFSGYLKVGGVDDFLEILAQEDPFPSHVHARRGPVAGV